MFGYWTHHPLNIIYTMENLHNSPPMEALTTVRNYFRKNDIPVPALIEQYFCEPESSMTESRKRVRTSFKCFGETKENNMDMITKVPGLKHISGDIFKLLDKYQLMDCRLVNKSWKEIVDQPMLNLKKMKSEDTDIPEDVHKSWKLLAQKLNDEEDHES